jgi:polyphosphate kinase
MPRKLDRRVEVLTPVEAPALQERLDQILERLLAADVNVWELNDRTWRRVPNVHGRNAQSELQALAQERSRSD